MQWGFWHPRVASSHFSVAILAFRLRIPVQFGVPRALTREPDLSIGMAHPTTPWPVALAES
jgi:hypothetical protein